MHRIGGLEKQDGTGNVNYDPENHELHGAHLRAAKVARHRRTTSRRSTSTTPGDADVLVLGWGSTWGVDQRGGAPGPRRGQEGRPRAPRAPQPVPADLGEVLARYPKVLVPEMNLGQLSRLVRAEFLVDAVSLTKVQGVPFTRGRDRSQDPGDARMTDVDARRHRREDESRRRGQARAARTSRPTRRSAGAPAAATTRSSPTCSC